MTCAVIATGDDDAVEAAVKKVVRFEEFKTARDAGRRTQSSPAAEAETPQLRESRPALTASEIAHRFAMLSYLRRQAT
jgi:hypothetical protein